MLRELLNIRKDSAVKLDKILKSSIVLALVVFLCVLLLVPSVAFAQDNINKLPNELINPGSLDVSSDESISIANAIWSIPLNRYSVGDTLEYYSTVGKDGHKVNNSDIRYIPVAGANLSGDTFVLERTLTPGATSTPDDDWVLVWEDNFNGSGQPNSSNWNYNVGNGYNSGSGYFDGWGNGEWEWYRPGNAYQENGNLVIRADYNSSPATIIGRNWYQFSARLTTQGKRSWQYGRIEARIAIPSVPGTWPAFWMMGESCDATYTNNYNVAMSYYDTLATNWASCGEIDIMEHRNTESVIVQNLFWDTRIGVYPWEDGRNAFNASENIYVGDVTQFHLYTLEWDSTELRWYVDRESNPDPTKTVNITGSNQEEFYKPFFLMLNLAIQGQFTGPTDPNINDFPLYMYVDYVRVWQQQGPIIDFVTRFYQECLSRDPDGAGLNGWVDLLVTKVKTGADVAYGFVFSEEFTARGVSNEEYLTILYRAFFNREPDSAGYSGWLDYLNTGKSREWVLAGFINSQEFKNLCSAYGINPGSLDVDSGTDTTQIAAFVTRFYQECLSRDPDSQGLNGWVDWLVTGAKTGADVAYGFVFSDEFIARGVSNEEYLNILYRAFFNREPDYAGYSGWLDYLNTGKSRVWVLAGFINSQEFKNLCASYGINPGSINI